MIRQKGYCSASVLMKPERRILLRYARCWNASPKARTDTKSGSCTSIQLKLRELFLDVSTSIANCSGLHGQNPSTSFMSRPGATDLTAAVSASESKAYDTSRRDLDCNSRAG